MPVIESCATALYAPLGCRWSRCRRRGPWRAVHTHDLRPALHPPAKKRVVPAVGTMMSPSTWRAQNVETTSRSRWTRRWCSRPGPDSPAPRLVLHRAGHDREEGVGQIVQDQADRGAAPILDPQVPGDVVALVPQIAARLSRPWLWYPARHAARPPPRGRPSSDSHRRRSPRPSSSGGRSRCSSG